MTKLHIESSVFPALDDQLRQAQDCMVSAHRNLRMVAKEGLPPGIYRNEVDILDRHCDHMTTTIQHIRRFVSRSATAYEQVERQLNTNAERITTSLSIGSSYYDTLAWGMESIMSLVHSKPAKTKTSMGYREWYTEWFDTNHDFHFRGLRNRTVRSFILDGISAEGEAGIHLVNSNRWSRNDHITNRIGVQVGNAEINGNVQGKLFDGKHFDPQVQAEITAKASLIHGVIAQNWNNERMGFGVQASGDVGVAQASGKAVISKEEFTVKGNVGAAALQGEVKGTMEFLGATITVTAEGEVGGVGIGTEFSASSHSMEIGGKLSCLLGGGMYIKVDW